MLGKVRLLVMFVLLEVVTPLMFVSELELMISLLLLSSQMSSSKVEGDRVSCLLAIHCTLWLEPVVGTPLESDKICTT